MMTFDTPEQARYLDVYHQILAYANPGARPMDTLRREATLLEKLEMFGLATTEGWVVPKLPSTLVLLPEEVTMLKTYCNLIPWKPAHARSVVAAMDFLSS